MSNKNYLKSELYELIKKDQAFFDLIQDALVDGLLFCDLEHPEKMWISPYKTKR